MVYIAAVFFAILTLLGLVLGAGYYDWFPVFSQRGMTDVEVFSVMGVLGAALLWIIWRVWFKPDLPKEARHQRRMARRVVAPQQKQLIKWLRDVTIL